LNKSFFDGAKKMKPYALPIFCLLASTLPLTIARSADLDSQSGADQAKDCSTHAEEFSKTDPKDAKNLQMFSPSYMLTINKHRRIPVFLHAVTGPNDATLIVLIHRKQGASDEIPVIDAICTDLNHAFQSHIPSNYISFESGDQEYIHLRFRLDPNSLRNTHWKKIPGDSVQMVEVKYPYPKPLPTPKPTDWCDPPPDKDVKVDKTNPTDMYFTMCKHNGRVHYYKYSVHMDVNGKDKLIDPLIIHQPQ
jgi:hypothetical protein